MKEISDVREFSGDESFLPIKALIKDNEISEKEAVLKYLKSFEADCGAGMSLIDEITGEETDSGISGYNDGEYYWDTRHIYHFEKYNMRLNEDFIHHVINK